MEARKGCRGLCIAFRIRGTRLQRRGRGREILVAAAAAFHGNAFTGMGIAQGNGLPEEYARSRNERIRFSLSLSLSLSVSLSLSLKARDHPKFPERENQPQRVS